MTGKIIEIIKPFGAQPKKTGGTFGPAMLAEVSFANGEKSNVWIWELKEIGNELEFEKKGEYWNVSKHGPVTTTGGDDVSKLLNLIYEDVQAIKAAVILDSQIARDLPDD